MKVKRDAESLGSRNSKGKPHNMPESRPDLRSGPTKARYRLSKELQCLSGFYKWARFMSRVGVDVLP